MKMRFAPFLLLLLFLSVSAQTVLPLRRHLRMAAALESPAESQNEPETTSKASQGKATWLDQYRGLLARWMPRSSSEVTESDGEKSRQQQTSARTYPVRRRNPLAAVSAFNRRIGPEMPEEEAEGRIRHPHFFGPEQIVQEEEKMPLKQHHARKTPTEDDGANVVAPRRYAGPEKSGEGNKSFLSSLLGSLLPVFDVGGPAGPLAVPALGSPQSYARVSKNPHTTQTRFAQYGGENASPAALLQENGGKLKYEIGDARNPAGRPAAAAEAGNLAVRSGYAQVNRQNQNPRLKKMPQSDVRKGDMHPDPRISSQSDNEIPDGGGGGNATTVTTTTSALRSAAAASPEMDVATFCAEATKLRGEIGAGRAFYDRLWSLVRRHNVPIAKEEGGGGDATSDRQIVVLMNGVCKMSMINDVRQPHEATTKVADMDSTSEQGFIEDSGFIRASNPRKRMSGPEENNKGREKPVEQTSGPFLSARFDENGFDDEEEEDDEIITAKPDNSHLPMPNSREKEAEDAFVVSGGFTFAPDKKPRQEPDNFSMKPGLVVDGDLEGLDKRQGRPPPVHGHREPPPPRNDRRPQQSDSFHTNRAHQNDYFPLNDRGAGNHPRRPPLPPPPANFQSSQPRNDFPQQRPSAAWSNQQQAQRKQFDPHSATTLHQLAAQGLPSHAPASVNREVRRTTGPANPNPTVPRPVISTTLVPFRHYTNFDRLDAVSIAVDTLHHGSTGAASPLPIDLPENPSPSAAPAGSPTNNGSKNERNVTNDDDVHYVYNVTFLSPEEEVPKRSDSGLHEISNSTTKDEGASSSSEYYPYEDDKSNEIIRTTTHETLRTEVAPLSVLPDQPRKDNGPGLSSPVDDSSVVSSNYYPVLTTDDEGMDAAAVRNTKPFFTPTTRGSSQPRGSGSRSSGPRQNSNQFTEFHAPPDVEMSYGTKTPVFGVEKHTDSSRNKILAETGGFSTFQKPQSVPKPRVPIKEEESLRRPTTTAATTTLPTTTTTVTTMSDASTTTAKSDEYYYVYEDYDTKDGETAAGGSSSSSNETELGEMQEPANDEKNNSYAAGEQQGATKSANESGINDRNNNDQGSFVNVETTTSITTSLMTVMDDTSPPSPLLLPLPAFPNNFAGDMTTEAGKPDKEELQVFTEHGFNYVETEGDGQADNREADHSTDKGKVKQPFSGKEVHNAKKDLAVDIVSKKGTADHETHLKIEETIDTKEKLAGKLEDDVNENAVSEQIFKSSMRNDRFAEDGLRSSDLAIEPSPVRESSDLEENLNPEKLAYILIGVCCGLSILCLIVVAVSIGYKSETHYRLDDGRRKRHIRLLKASVSEEGSSRSSNSGSGSTSQYSETDESDRNSDDMAGMKLGPWFNGKHNIQTLDRKSNMVFPTSVYLTNLEGQTKGLKLTSSDDDDILGVPVGAPPAAAASSSADNASLSSFDTIRTDPNLLQDLVVPH